MFGCDEFCTYCIVPYTRGKERSRRPEAIIEEVKELVNQGYVEVTLLGQNVNAYGKDLKDINYTFADLLKDLNKIDIKRIRFTTSHPRDLDDATIDAMALGGNIMPHLHLPVQSGNNRVLKKMNRKYTREEYLEKIKKLKEKVPGISITTDIIVAFPGETEEEFNDTLTLVDEVEYEGAYTFIYSKRTGTPAAAMENQVPEQIVKEGFDKLLKVVQETARMRVKRYEGQIMSALVEEVNEQDSHLVTARLSNNTIVHFEGDASLIGQIVDVSLEKCEGFYYIGKRIR